MGGADHAANLVEPGAAVRERRPGGRLGGVIAALLALNLLAALLLAAGLAARGHRFQLQLPEFDQQLRLAGLLGTRRRGALWSSSGELGGWPLTASIRDGGRQPDLRVEVEGPTGGFSKAAPPGSTGRRSGPDAELMQRTSLQANQDTVLACLHGEARAALLALVQAGWTVEALRSPERLVAQRTGPAPGLAADLERLVTLIRALAPPADVPAAVAERFVTERRTSIRLDCLQWLVDWHGFHAATQEALTRARADREEPVQRFALRHALADGGELSDEEALVMMASGLDADRLAGLHALRPDQPLPEKELLACLRAGGEAVAVRAAQLLSVRGGRLAMTELLRASRRPDLDGASRGRIAAAHALILDRLGGGTNAGGLALAGAQPAALSLVEQREAGQLAVVPPKEPQG